MRVEICPLIGQMASPQGPVGVAWPQIERLILDDREIAKIKTWPGAPIAIYPHVTVSEAEKRAISEAIAAKRGGVPPAEIICQSRLYELLAAQEDELEDDDDE